GYKPFGLYIRLRTGLLSAHNGIGVIVDTSSWKIECVKTAMADANEAFSKVGASMFRVRGVC
ncbi:MAG: hypothetical protein ACXWAS_12855, partial [Methylobacter sp.]